MFLEHIRSLVFSAFAQMRVKQTSNPQQGCSCKADKIKICLTVVRNYSPRAFLSARAARNRVERGKMAKFKRRAQSK